MNVRATFSVVLFFVLVTGTGCTKSLEMTYNPAAYQLPQGVAKFEDRVVSQFETETLPPTGTPVVMQRTEPTEVASTTLTDLEPGFAEAVAAVLLGDTTE